MFFVSFFCFEFLFQYFVKVRRALGDFGVPIAIIVVGAMTRVAHDTYTEKLSVPEGLSPTQPGRGWISPFELPVWAIFAASFPAFLVYILLFMETHISE